MSSNLKSTNVAKATATQIKAAPALLKAVHATSRDASTRYLQVFDSNANGSPDTTTVIYQWPIPPMAGSIPGQIVIGNDFFCGQGGDMTQGWKFTNGLVVGISTTSGSYVAATDANHDFAVTYN